MFEIEHYYNLGPDRSWKHGSYQPGQTVKFRVGQFRNRLDDYNFLVTVDNVKEFILEFDWL